MTYPILFSSLKTAGLELSNRIVMTAMHLGYTPGGEVTDRLIDFYKLRARGGAGLIIVGGCRIDEYGGMQDMIRIDDDLCVEGLRRLTDEIKAEGAKVAAQLYQAGRYAHSSMIGGKKPVSASAVRSKLTGEIPRSLDLDEIPLIQDKFAEAAARARKSGFDAVEILGSAGYLISQFLSGITNRRVDAYGGSPGNRMRFGIEVVEKVRHAVGPEFPVIMRLAGNDFMEGGGTNAEARDFAAALEKAGVNMFNITGGWHETRVPQLTMSVPRHNYVYLARGIKTAVSVPVIASNRINDPMDAEEILREGGVDLVTMARALIADPELPEKARRGESRRILHCIACNQGCFDNVFQGKPATCLVNPRAGRERRAKIEDAPVKRKILVIGGGPGGMKAACTAAERGHEVTLVEKGPRLGGQLLLNQRIPGREEILTAAADLESNLEALHVRIIRDKTADAEFVRAMAPDAVILGTGASPVLPDIAGISSPNVVQAWDVLNGRVGVGKRVVIIGGNAVGLETALYLANIGTLGPETLHFLMINRAESPETINALLQRGNKIVTIVEMTKKTGQDIGVSTRWTVKSELKRLGVTLMTRTEAVGVTPESLEIKTGGERQFLPADSIVVAAGSRAEKSILDEISSLVKEIHVIGDASDPRNALAAIKEGMETGAKV